MTCQDAAVIRNKVTTYQEQHELSRGNSLCLQGSGDRLGYRSICFCPDIVFERGRTFCDVVASLNNSRRIDDGRLGKEVISQQVETLDPSAFEGCVREVGLEARRHDEAEVRTCREARIREGTEANGRGWVR